MEISMSQTAAEIDFKLKPEVARLPFGSPVAEVVAVIQREGGVILTGMLTSDEVDAINQELDVVMSEVRDEAYHSDENWPEDFFGFHTKRLPHVMKYSETYRNRVLDNDQLLEYVAEFVPGAPGTQTYFGTIVLEIHPGEKAQGLHRDGGGFAAALGLDHRDGQNIVVTALLAMTDVTEDMGATRVVPGSHLWEDYSVIPPQEDTVPAVLNAGDIFFYPGKTLHGGGANTTKDKPRRVIATSYTVPFFKGEEAYPFILSADEVKTYPYRVQQSMSFRSVSLVGETPGFLWRAKTRPLEDYLDFNG